MFADQGSKAAKPSNERTAKTDAPQQETGMVQPPVLSLPKGGGAIRGMGEKFAANPVTGTGSMTVPIAISPGRSGFGPQLSLSYDSGAGNGPFGFGWSLSVPSITRKTDKGLPRYIDGGEHQPDSDVFILSGAEDLVPVYRQDPEGNWVLDAQGNLVFHEDERDGYRVRRYRPRIEGLFARIERWTNISTGETHWRSISKDNITTLYGKDNDSRIFDPSDPDPAHPTRIFSWLICQSYDDKGNAIVYHYAAEDDRDVDHAQANERNRVRTANRYLKHIRYGNRTPNRDDQGKAIDPATLPAATWMFEVVFDYGEHNQAAPLPNDAGVWPRRADPFSTYRAGFEVRTYRLCQRVLMFHHFPGELEVGANCLVRSTDFTYAYEADPQAAANPIFSKLLAATQTGYKRQASGGYLAKSLPPLEFSYSEAVLQNQVLDVDAASLENLPLGLDGAAYQWVDLDGEGISGILTEQGEGWFYKRNLGPLNEVGRNGIAQLEAKFAPLERIATKPAATLAGQAQFLDLAGDGQVDLVQMHGPLRGFYERVVDEQGQRLDWSPFRPFRCWPNVDLGDPNLKFVDLTGDGHADILITEGEALTWHPSLAEDGYGPAVRLSLPLDEEKGPRLVFANSEQAIYLADLSGDGLTDLVRIRNGEVCYWPNLGYGRFGAKVTMDNAPRFDAPDQFNQQRIRLADIDGSGTTDIIYLHRNGVRVYFNQSGNRWAAAQTIPFPAVDNLTAVQAVDLLGDGTACLVWSSPLPGAAQRPLHYLKLMGKQKPHLLVKTVNNLGAETIVHYAPSTQFYLADKAAGKPWITRLPFPVHVVERVETFDAISQNRFVTRYAYHHGYFDGEEREFRGFGLVEQFDTEEFTALTADGTLPDATNIDAASHVPPVLTKSWFHTGVYLDRDHISDFFAGLLDAHDHGEYYREPGLTDAEAKLRLLPDTILPPDLTPEEEREACRALKGAMLRQETYALDGTDKAAIPYTVTEQNFTIERLQPLGDNQHGVFFTHPREAISYHYERNPADPRISHALTLDVDPYGNVLKEVAIGYSRRETIRVVDHLGVVTEIPNPGLNELGPDDQKKQTRTLITYTENRVAKDPITGVIDTANDYRTPLPAETQTFELTGFKPENNAARFSFDEWTRNGFALPVSAVGIPYEETADNVSKQKRLIEHLRTVYRKGDLTGFLPLGELDPLALPGESYKLAFTPGLLDIYSSKITLADLTSILQNEGKYVNLDGDGQWWIPSGRVFYSSNSADAPAQELTAAMAHFFLPRRYRDPFANNTLVDYDAHDLLVTHTQDPVQNSVRAENNYRVLQAWRMTDPNGNHAEAAFDTLGMMMATAVIGKNGEGDKLEGFTTDLTQAELDAFFAAPRPPNRALLGKASTRILYDVDRYQREGKPTYAATLARELHASDPAGATCKIQVSLSYADGFGREIQKKIQAEKGALQPGGAAVEPRWVGSGWTIFNNKGKPVRQYEPFFDDSHDFKFGQQVGVSPTLFYDPAERVVATLHPNHTVEKVIFDPWQQTTWDVNDMLTLNPKTDSDVSGFFTRLPDSDYLPTWYDRMIASTDTDEQNAAQRTEAHAATPTIAHFDALGRLFLTIADNGAQGKYATRVELDIEGNQRSVTDALGRSVMHYDYDILGTRIKQASMEAGARWMLANAAGKPIRAWDDRHFTRRMIYDALQRPTGLFVTEPAGERLAEQTIYGEAKPSPEATNHRGKVWQVRDDAGIVTSDEYDFKGSLLRSQRDLRTAYKTPANWAQLPAPATSETFASSSKFDALGRVIEAVAPDGSVTQPRYNEANLLEAVDVRLGGTAQTTPFVRNIDYDAKGQRTRIEYNQAATPISTEYTYDPDTFRLTRLITTRPNHPIATEHTLQDLHYTYDPAGNITHIQDDAQQTIYFRNQRVEPSSDYVYDAIYRLISAQGREHLGQTGGQRNPPTAPDAFNQFHSHLDHPGNGDALGRYVEEYDYDAVGNFNVMRHRGSDPAHPGWTRSYAYKEDSLTEPATPAQPVKKSNRLSSTTIGNGVPEPYTYDAHGNMTAMPHLPTMRWDFEDQLTEVDLQGGGTAYYVYDAAGQRVRKVVEHNGATVEERIYLGGYEVYRKRQGAVLQLERQTLHVMDDKQRIALVETRTQGNDPAPQQLIRYQFGNHLGSTSLELDEQAQIISYEEYFPYGSTSYQAVRSQTETPKRYRYTGKERDEESGLYYHGARYYAPWLGRWTATDSSQRPDHVNLYAYVNCSPIRLHDPNGKDEQLGFWDFQAEYWKGVGTGAAEFAGGLGNAVAHPIDTANAMGRAASEAYRRDGVLGAVNQFNPAYHTMVAGYEYYQAASRGNPREAGRQAFHAVSGAASTVLIATGVGGLAGGGGAAGGASAAVRVPTLATAVTTTGETMMGVGSRVVSIPGRLVAAGPPVATAGAGVLMMAANEPPQGGEGSNPSAPPRSQPGSGSGQGSGRSGSSRGTPAAVARPSLLQQATRAGVREVIEDGPVEVFAHGTTTAAAEELVSSQGGSLSANAGNFGGKFFTVPSVDVAEVFAARAAVRVAGQEPAVVGVALPRAISDQLRTQGLLRLGPIENPPPGVLPSAQQWIFQPGALDTLKNQGFFFRAQ